jgi:ribosome biogenesis GTPase
MELKTLGFDAWFQNAAGSAKNGERRIARILTVDRDSYLIQGESHAVRAELAGKLLFNADSPMELPVVGDFVRAQYFDDDSLAIVHEILPRKSVLKRKTPDRKIEYQLIAANIDTAFIVQSLDNNFNLRRLERYLVMIHEGRIAPFLLLSKSDLLESVDIDKKVRQVHAGMPDLPVLALSNETNAGFDRLNEILTPGKTFCLLGSSGVGKTTLINRLVAEAVFETRSVREKDGRGRHTTARRQLILLENNAMIIDTPGMRELGIIGVETGIQAAFEDIEALSGECRFHDCSHVHESGCAVAAAVKAGNISQERYQSFLKLTRESTYHKMSYLEKKRRDKAFGKMVKSVMQRKKERHDRGARTCQEFR